MQRSDLLSATPVPSGASGNSRQDQVTCYWTRHLFMLEVGGPEAL
jgi:hypothetical protein